MSEEKQIAQGERVKAFLEDEAVKEALVRVEQRAVADMLAADTDEKMRQARATVLVARDFAAKLAGVVGSGVQAKAQKEHREREQAARERSTVGRRA